MRRSAIDVADAAVAAVIAILRDEGPSEGRYLRQRLAARGLRLSGPAFYRIMAALEDAGGLVGWYVERPIGGVPVRARAYRLAGEPEPRFINCGAADLPDPALYKALGGLLVAAVFVYLAIASAAFQYRNPRADRGVLAFVRDFPAVVAWQKVAAYQLPDPAKEAP
jgi:hypothetical protein